jgi:pimeloyl-ACP methyl ester carboxylesterase
MKNSGNHSFSNPKFKSLVVTLIIVLCLAAVLVPSAAAAMSVTLESPSNNTTTMNNQPDFKFTATHSSNPTLNCTLWLKLSPSGSPAAYGNNNKTINGASTIIRPSSPVANGQYQWWINCSDGVTSVISEKRTITVNVIRGTRSFTASLDGSTRYYWLDEPDHFDGVTPTPLVIFLHGYGQDNTCYNTYYPGLEQVFRGNGWTVACPECRHVGATSYHDWYSAPSRSDITDVINLLEAQFNIDRSHIDTIGTSMGGGGALQYAMFNPRVIASACDVMGVTNFTEFYLWTTNSDLHNSIAAAFGGTPSQVPQVYKNESALGNEIRFRHTPVFLLHGSADTVVPVSNSRNLNASLSKAGYVVKYVEVMGAGHYGTDLIGGREQMIYEWFRDHPLWGNTHLLVGVLPNQQVYAKGQSLTLSVSVLNQVNPALEGTLTLTINGPGNYYYFSFQTVNLIANTVGEYSFNWSIPNVAGTYEVEVGLVPAQLTAYDSAWLVVD